MSPTLLEGFAVLLVIVIAWQIGIRIAPDIIGALQRARDQLFGSGNSERSVDKSSTSKEAKHDTKN